jgi:hypothetical protein
VIRRTAVAALALVAAATLSSCATFTDNANAARVGDVELPRDDLERYVHDALEARDSTDPPEEASGDIYRTVLGGWIVDELIRQYLAEQGLAITDDDRAAATEQTDSQLAGTTVSAFLRDYEIDSLATRLAFQNYSAGGDALLQFARGETVYVDPLYGYWHLETGLVQAMNSSTGG